MRRESVQRRLDAGVQHPDLVKGFTSGSVNFGAPPSDVEPQGAHVSKPVVLIAEELSPATVEALGPDFEIRHVDGADRAALLPAIADVDAILVRSATKVDAEALAAAKKLKVVARAGVGLDNVDVKAATQAGVMVVNAPTSNIVSAAELAVALLLACARNIAPASAALKARPVEALEVHRRRAHRQDRRRRRPRPHRPARRAAPLGVRREARRLRPLRPAGPRRAARHPDAQPRRAARRVRLHHRPPAEDARDRRPHRRGGAAQGQADRAHHQRRARRHRRRARALRRPQGGSRRRCRPRRLRHGAVHRLPALRVRVRRRHPAPRRLHRRGAGEGRHRRRALGAPRARRRARARRRQRPGRLDRRGRPPGHRARREPRPRRRLARHGAARGGRGRGARRDRRERREDPRALRAQGRLLGPRRPTRCPTSTRRSSPASAASASRSPPPPRAPSWRNTVRIHLSLTDGQRVVVGGTRDRSAQHPAAHRDRRLRRSTSR